jgi:hypothetical protein
MLETTYTLKLGQLLKITPNFYKYMWQKLKLEKLNITIKVMLKPSVTTIIETHSKVDITIIDVDNQMVIIQIQVGNNIVKDVLLDGRANVNIIIENLRTKLGLPKPRLAPYHLIMVDHTMTRPLRIIKNLKIHIRDISDVATFTVLQNNVVDFSYSMLLGRP